MPLWDLSITMANPEISGVQVVALGLLGGGGAVVSNAKSIDNCNDTTPILVLDHSHLTVRAAYVVFIYLFVHINKYKYKNKKYSNSAQGDPFGYKVNLPRDPTIKLQQRRLSS